MAVNKVVLGDQTLIDLTADSVTPDKLFKGITAHNMKGESIVGTMEGGSTPSEPTDNTAVIFADYDGNLIDTWTKDEVASKTALPTPPAHTGLVFEGWNWTLEDIKTDTTGQVITVGPFYHTVSGLTEIDIHLDVGTGKEVRLFKSLMDVEKDWGDGITNTEYIHTYSEYGDYTIKTPVKTDSYGDRILFEYSVNINGLCIKEVRPSQEVTSYTNLGSLVNNVPVIFNILNEDIKGFQSKDLYWGLNYYNGSKYVTVNKNNSQSTWSNSSTNRRRSIKYLYIPSSVTSIGSSAFYGCSSLQSINIPSSVTSIGSSAFYGCSSLQSINIPDGVTSIGEQAFYGCSSLQSITIPENVTSIGNGVFNECRSLQSITIPSSITSIGDYVFENCPSLQSITIPENVTSIGEGAFRGCYSLQNITIPSSVTSIGSNAFYNCTSFQSITIPSSVTSIGSNAFSYCNLVRYIKINTSAEIKSQALNFGRYSNPKRSGIIYDFSSVTAVPVLSASNGLTTTSYVSVIIVPDALYDEWIAATNWVAYASKIKKASEVETSEVTG